MPFSILFSISAVTTGASDSGIRYKPSRLPKWNHRISSPLTCRRCATRRARSLRCLFSLVPVNAAIFLHPARNSRHQSLLPFLTPDTCSIAMPSTPPVGFFCETAYSRATTLGPQHVCTKNPRSSARSPPTRSQFNPLCQLSLAQPRDSFFSIFLLLVYSSTSYYQCQHTCSCHR
ncbi:uncharacterized protein EDB93DRAFT_1177326 [Suillus bovinus]|uniref:uncharacterized protein n=1 Tax=Suillus bovinus TaxID=48563 RepID=UPI001B85DC79|nr:uncharacterized protein EDB93DRAFT_1177326 [Suillus bovinus]KAG2131996.1 hypothetical protein EDB93DRAFT_1177326 [Suillus bovinus]